MKHFASSSPPSASSLRSPLSDRVNARLDAFVRTDVLIAALYVSSWRVYSLAAFAVATGVWLALGIPRHVPPAALVVTPVIPYAVLLIHQRVIRRSSRERCSPGYPSPPPRPTSTLAGAASSMSQMSSAIAT